MLDNRSQLSKTTLTLHWLVGLMMISLLSIGIYMTETKAYGL
ncbi:MAG: cytochrome b, partial [Pseudomonadales bacterium]|nr:cytochrome b [Pseudomonadales bacterium]